jgi:hypothetical protein
MLPSRHAGTRFCPHLLAHREQREARAVLDLDPVGVTDEVVLGFARPTFAMDTFRAIRLATSATLLPACS